LLLLFLSSTAAFRPPLAAGRELILSLPRLIHPIPSPIPSRTAPRTQTQAMPLAPSPLPQTALPSAAAPPAVLPGLENFGQVLNGCAPEKYASLPPDQKARCSRPGAGVALQELPNLMGSPSHVKDEAHWQAEWAREVSPALLPCGGFVDLICVLGKIADGSLGDYDDPSRWPSYAVKQLAPEDFYKAEQAYDAWRQQHPVSTPEEQTHPVR
jgi:hypothetical protein